MASPTFTLNPTFAGSSTFSSSFQQVLTRAVQMASLPMQQMQNHVNDLTSQQTTLSSLEATFASLQAALTQVSGDASGSLAANVSDPSVASATVTSSALPGTYSIQVDSLGSSTTTLSQDTLSKVTDPAIDNISSASSFTLTVNGHAFSLTPASETLESLAQSINNSGAGIQATIVNLGGSSAPDYRLSVVSSNLGSDSIGLSDGTNDLLDTLSTGTDAQYKLNGSSTELQSNSQQVTVAPGLTVNLLGKSQSGQPATITVWHDFSSLQYALSSFANAYNTAVSAVSSQHGKNAGALAGQSIVFSLSDALSSIANFNNGSGVNGSLATLGLSVDQTGQMSFDSSNITNQNAAQIQQFLGSAGSGGFLQTVNQALSSVADTSNGAIHNELTSLQTQITTQNSNITDAQTRIADLEANLLAQLSEADAAIATLQSQKTYFADLFQAEYPTRSS